MTNQNVLHTCQAGHQKVLGRRATPPRLSSPYTFCESLCLTPGKVHNYHDLNLNRTIRQRLSVIWESKISLATRYLCTMFNVCILNMNPPFLVRFRVVFCVYFFPSNLFAIWIERAFCFPLANLGVISCCSAHCKLLFPMVKLYDTIDKNFTTSKNTIEFRVTCAYYRTFLSWPWQGDSSKQ